MAAPATPMHHETAVTNRSFADPTASFGRRIAAFVIDLALISAVSVVTMGLLADRTDFSTSFEAELACSFMDAASSETLCIPIDAVAYTLSANRFAAAVLLPHVVLWFAFAVAQGLTGASPGKAVMGVRVVDAEGRPLGVWKALGRKALTVVDGFPWIAPMGLGVLVAAASAQHQRIADRVMQSFVVRKSDLGHPVAVDPAAATRSVVATGATAAPLNVATAPAHATTAPVSNQPGATRVVAAPVGQAWDPTLQRWVFTSEDGRRQAWDEPTNQWFQLD